MKNQYQVSLFAVCAIAIVSLTRFLPHPPNFTALGAMAIFGGALFQSKSLRFFIPFIILFITDLVLNNFVYQISDSFTLFYEGAFFTYLAFGLIILFSSFAVKQVKLARVTSVSLIASVIFFLVSNFGVWSSGLLYEKSISGLITCYVAALPFALNTIAGDLFFSGVLFGSYVLAEKKFFALQTEKI